MLIIELRHFINKGAFVRACVMCSKTHTTWQEKNVHKVGPLYFSYTVLINLSKQATDNPVQIKRTENIQFPWHNKDLV